MFPASTKAGVKRTSEMVETAGRDLKEPDLYLVFLTEIL